MDRKKILFGIKIFVAISLISQLGIFIYSSYQNGGISFKLPFHKMHYCLLGIALCLSWLEGPISGLRIYFIMRIINPCITHLSSIKAAYGNIFLGAATPSQTGGGVAQIYFISKDNIPIAQATAGSILTFVCTLTFLTTSLISTSMFTSPKLGHSFQLMMKSAAILVASTTLILLISILFTHPINNFKFSLFIRLKKRGLIKDKKGKIENLLKKVAAGLVTYRESILLMYKRGLFPLFLGFVFTCLFFAIRFIIPYFIIIGLGGSTNIVEVMYIQLFITLISYFSPTPGASGVAEVSSLVLMASFVENPLIPVYTFLWRLCTLYVNCTIGGFLLYREVRRSDDSS